MCFFFNDTATTEIYTLSLHDALPILSQRTLPFYYPCRLPVRLRRVLAHARVRPTKDQPSCARSHARLRSEEHTSELQSRQYLVCRLLLEKKKRIKSLPYTY